MGHLLIYVSITLQIRHDESEGVSNHELRDCLLNHLFMAQIKENSQLRVTGLCEFPEQMASNADNVSIWRRHHEWLAAIKHWILIYVSRVHFCIFFKEWFRRGNSVVLPITHSIDHLYHAMNAKAEFAANVGNKAIRAKIPQGDMKRCRYSCLNNWNHGALYGEIYLTIRNVCYTNHLKQTSHSCSMIW